MGAQDEIQERWEYLQAGAVLGANLTTLARDHSLEQVSTAVALLTRDQLEAAVTAMALVHAANAPLVDAT